MQKKKVILINTPGKQEKNYAMERNKIQSVLNVAY